MTEAKKAATGKASEVSIVHRDAAGAERKFIAIDNHAKLSRQDWYAVVVVVVCGEGVGVGWGAAVRLLAFDVPGACPVC